MPGLFYSKKMKTVLITGASRGIGRCTALELLAAGHRVLVLSRQPEALAEERKQYPKLEVLHADINQWEEVGQMIRNRVHQIDVLIHNAAAFLNKPFAEMRGEDFDFIYHTNVKVPYFLTQQLVELIPAGGQVLAISSVGGVDGSVKFPGLSLYSSSKGALNILVECLAEELRPRGVVVNALALGSSATEMFKAAFPDAEAASQPEEMGKYIAQFALNVGHLVNGRVHQLASSNP